MRKAYSGLLLVIGTAVGIGLNEFVLAAYKPARAERPAFRANERTVVENRIYPKLSATLRYTTNSLGFRGPELPADGRPRLVTVGGSTTHCHINSDEHAWPHLLGKSLPGVWINNAGLAGQSSFGHLELLPDILARARPDAVVLMAGINDMGREAPWGSRLPPFLLRSELVGLILSVHGRYLATRAGLPFEVGFDPRTARRISTAEDAAEKQLSRHRRRFVPEYRERLRRLVRLTREAGSLPVLVTQAALYGGADLARVEIVPGVDGELQWKILELYNGATRQVAGEEKAALIDLAALLPKDSAYFVDTIHFSDAGNAQVAKLLAPRLRSILKGR